MPRLGEVEGGRQQPWEVDQTERLGLGTRASRRGEEGEGASLIVMATEESGRGRKSEGEKK